MNEKLQNYETIRDIDLQMSIGLQQFELQGWKTTAASALHFEVNNKLDKNVCIMIMMIL